jgi:hypothetical protein
MEKDENVKRSYRRVWSEKFEEGKKSKRKGNNWKEVRNLTGGGRSGIF